MENSKKEKELQEVKEKLKEKEENLKAQKKITKSAQEVAVQAATLLRDETRKQTTTAIVAAFGFLIALVWRDTIQGYTNHLIHELSLPIPIALLTLYTTIVTTLIAVVGIVLVTRWSLRRGGKLKDFKIPPMPTN